MLATDSEGVNDTLVRGGDRMGTPEYHFVTVWTLRGTREEVWDILSDAPGLARWWPSVYLEVSELHAGSADGIGRRIALHTAGWLPYTLRWSFAVVSSEKPCGFSIAAEGDFVGCGVWSFEQIGDDVRVTYDWRIRAEKPLLRSLTFLLRPVFSANHRWAMARGEESLRLELARRRAHTPDERARIPAPPPPTWWRHARRIDAPGAAP